MHPAPFQYYRPTTLAEALELLSRLEGARPLAGGQSLLPLMKLRLSTPSALVDLCRIPGLAGIDRENGELVIGATTVYADVVASSEVQAGCPVLAETVRLIGDMQVRNRGTVGGSVAHADPAADLPALLVALDATVVAAGPGGERRIPARDFFLGSFRTALEAGELVTGLRVPILKRGTAGAYLKRPHPASRYAVVGAAAVISLEDGRCEAAALAVGGVTDRPVLVADAERALLGRDPEETARAAAAAVPDALPDAVGDLFASGEYRVHLATVLARRALLRAAERARR